VRERAVLRSRWTFGLRRYGGRSFVVDYYSPRRVRPVRPLLLRRAVRAPLTDPPPPTALVLVYVRAASPGDGAFVSAFRAGGPARRLVRGSLLSIIYTGKHGISIVYLGKSILFWAGWGIENSQLFPARPRGARLGGRVCPHFPRAPGAGRASPARGRRAGRSPRIMRTPRLVRGAGRLGQWDPPHEQGRPHRLHLGGQKRRVLTRRVVSRAGHGHLTGVMRGTTCA